MSLILQPATGTGQSVIVYYSPTQETTLYSISTVCIHLFHHPRFSCDDVLTFVRRYGTGRFTKRDETMLTPLTPLTCSSNLVDSGFEYPLHQAINIDSESRTASRIPNTTSIIPQFTIPQLPVSQSSHHHNVTHTHTLNIHKHRDITIDHTAVIHPDPIHITDTTTSPYHG